eukprot:augustus_masked-scaffold_8-processed-gene-8.7-mRNA-1 protein AED:0.01 eAED:0.01 QI:0/-1/0/1/-1/1/1/0/457
MKNYELPKFLSLAAEQTEKNYLSKEFAIALDEKSWTKRDEFYFPSRENSSEPCLYFCGHSLGLQPKKTEKYIQRELEKWRNLGVEGHFTKVDEEDFGWAEWDTALVENMAKVVGAETDEVVLMNSLTTNLHFLLNAFYKPSTKKYKIIIEEHAFPSDFFAVESLIQSRGFSSKEGIIKLDTKDGRVSTDDILSLISSHKDDLALVLLPGIQYYTGQCFEMGKISNFIQELNKKSAEKICFGLDLAHAVGNVQLKLTEWEVDFAVWCTYKYMNSGPGGIGGAFIPRKYFKDLNLKRLTGWWSHRLQDRFEMRHELHLTNSALQFQVSNPPILLLASLKASLDIFAEVGMDNVTKKSKCLTRYMEILIEELINRNSAQGRIIDVITPGYDRVSERGAQLSIKVQGDLVKVFNLLQKKSVICDMRRPNVLRLAPCPLYNTFIDVFELVSTIKDCLVEAKD